MRFTELRPDISPGQGWVGIMFRSQHFFANYGHLVYVVSDGSVRRTQPVDEFYKHQQDPFLGQIAGFGLTDWLQWDLQFDEYNLLGTVNGVQFNVPVTAMQFCYAAGLIRFQTHLPRACIRMVNVETVQ